MQRIRGLGPVVIASVAIAVSAADAGARGRNCATAGKTVSRNAFVRVYERTKTVVGPDQGEETAERDEERVWACRLATGQTVRLDGPCSSSDVAFSDLAGCDEQWTWVDQKGVYVGMSFDRNGSGFKNRNQIVWAKLGARPARRIAYKLQKPTDFSEPKVAQLHISIRGGLVFGMRGVHVAGSKRNHSVIATIAPRVPHRKPRYRELDSSPDVVASSLRATGRIASWIHGDHRRHAHWR